MDKLDRAYAEAYAVELRTERYADGQFKRAVADSHALERAAHKLRLIYDQGGTA